MLVSVNPYAYIGRLAAMGFTPIGLDGAAFKACSVAEPNLFSDYSSQLTSGERVVGFVSHSAKAHDYAAAAPIVRGAGGVACGLDGGELSLAAGRQGCVFANTDRVRDSLLEAMHG